MELTGREVRPHIGLVGGERIELGDFSLEVLCLAGHSHGDLGLYDAERKLLFSGEALLASGAKDDADNVVAPPYYESAENYDAALGLTAELDVDVMCTSHFGVIRAGEARDHILESRTFFDAYERDVLETVVCGAGQFDAEQTARQFAEKFSPFEFRLETMQLVNTHLAHLQRKGKVVEKDGHYTAV